jgi:hypothetical protein
MSRSPTTREWEISFQLNISPRGRPTIKFPEEEIGILPEGSSALFLDKKTFSESFSLIAVENEEDREGYDRSYNCECALDHL